MRGPAGETLEAADTDRCKMSKWWKLKRIPDAVLWRKYIYLEKELKISQPAVKGEGQKA